MRHRASDHNPAFDSASYGRVFDSAGYKADYSADHIAGYSAGCGDDFGLTADTSALPGAFEAYVQPATESAPPKGKPFAVAGTAAVALLGAALVITGATQSVRADTLPGIAMPQTGPHMIVMHDGGTASARHRAGGPASARPANTPTTPSNPAVRPAVRPAQGTQLPNTIRLPRGGTAYLVHVQVTSDGSLPIPASVSQAVWWGTGLNASSGATVFAGHVNWAGAIGPFAELWQDQAGAVVTIRDNSGTQRRYQVTQVLTLNKDQLPQQAPVLFSADGPPRIVLATCGGEWVGGSLGYADNRVVVATPIGN